MQLNKLNKRHDLMVNLDELEKEIDAYFDNITKEELKKDLEKVGFVVKEVNLTDVESFLSNINIYMFDDEEDYVVENDTNLFASDADDLWELAA